jgi:hypothetical protein
MIVKLTPVENFFTYYYVTIIKDDEVKTVAITSSEMKRIEGRAERMNLIKQRSTIWTRLKLALQVIKG